MQIDIQLTHEPIGDGPPVHPEWASGAGAWVEFRGIVRGEEEGHTIAAIEYEAYPEMAIRQMRHILTDLGITHPCVAVRVVHRLGRVPVGETAIHACLAAKHRTEAFTLLTGFMDRLKQDVPIWKVRAVPTPPAPDCRILV